MSKQKETHTIQIITKISFPLTTLWSCATRGQNLVNGLVYCWVPTFFCMRSSVVLAGSLRNFLSRTVTTLPLTLKTVRPVASVISQSPPLMDIPFLDTANDETCGKQYWGPTTALLLLPPPPCIPCWAPTRCMPPPRPYPWPPPPTSWAYPGAPAVTAAWAGPSPWPYLWSDPTALWGPTPPWAYPWPDPTNPWEANSCPYPWGPPLPPPTPPPVGEL